MPPLRSGIRHSEERAGLSENPDFGHSFSPNFTKITKNRLKKQISDSDPEAQQDTGKSVQRVFQQILNYHPYGRKRTAYIRDNKQIEFGHSISLPVHDINIFKKNLRDNSSLISYAAQYPSQKIAIECQHYNFRSNIAYSGSVGDFQLRKEFLENEEYRYSILEFIKIADIGIENIKLEESALENVLKKQVLFEHKLDERRIHFNEFQESSGTLKFLAILSEVLHSLKNGTLLILDEIELKLHQDLVAYIIGLYNNEHYNTNNAQLIFSFHNTSFMKILTPEQLWFTEKNDSGRTEIFSASHFEDIQNLHERNLEKLYRIGRFGAKPRGI